MEEGGFGLGTFLLPSSESAEEDRLFSIITTLNVCKPYEFEFAASN
jgi:hypothetical protein